MTRTGQSCCNKTEKMRKYMGMFRELTNGTYVHSLMLGFDEEDVRALQLRANSSYSYMCLPLLWRGFREATTEVPFATCRTGSTRTS